MQIWRPSLIIPFLLLFLAPSVSTEVHRKKFSTASAYVIVEILDNDLVHFEVKYRAQRMAIGPHSVSEKGRAWEIAL
jgi:hypothetical protein